MLHQRLVDLARVARLPERPLSAGRGLRSSKPEDWLVEAF
jgi:hypothetical protein